MKIVDEKKLNSFTCLEIENIVKSFLLRSIETTLSEMIGKWLGEQSISILLISIETTISEMIGMCPILKSIIIVLILIETTLSAMIGRWLGEQSISMKTDSHFVSE